MRARLVGGALAAFVLLAGCGEKRVDPSTTVAPVLPTVAPVLTFAPNGETMNVKAIDNNFLPQALEVVAGTEVVFENNGRNAHNIVPEGDLEVKSWGVLDTAFEPKDTYSHVFDTPGTYVYYCTIHGTASAGMFGTIVVTAP